MAQLSDENHVFTVYKHTSPSNKVYIGITSKPNVKNRWNRGEGYRSCTKMYNAIQKYGWDNFTHEILFTNLTQNEAEIKERELIAFYKSTDSDYGYNLLPGGNYIFNRETREKMVVAGRKKDMKKAQIAAIRVNTGKHRDKETKEKIRKKLIGKKFTEDRIRKIKNTRLCKPVIQFTLDGSYIKTFPSTLEASKQTGISMSRIRDCCIGRTLNPTRYRWKYVDDEDVISQKRC